jgi:uncharacterized RmlC-like cupin family protein
MRDVLRGRPGEARAGRQGEQCFVAANVPHAPRNESGKPCTAIVVHSSGNDQDGIVLLPHLDAKLAQRLVAGG